ASLPPVERRHRRVDVDAGGEALLDERARERLGFVFGHGGQDQDQISHRSSTVIGVFGLVLWVKLLLRVSRVATADIRSRPKRRAPEPARPGRARRIVHVLLLFVASIIIVDTLVGERGLLAMLRARKAYDELTLALSRQRAENVRLREEARRLREDPAAIEEIARRDLGLIRPGEKLFIVKDVPPPTR